MKYSKKELLSRAKYLEFMLISKYKLTGAKTIVREINRLLKTETKRRKGENE